MAAVASKDILGALDFDGESFYWFENLYTPSRKLPMGPDDLKTVKECLRQAKMAGVIEPPEAFLASVFGGQDLSEEVTKFRDASQKMLYIVCEIMVAHARADTEMEKLVAKVDAIDRTQKLNAVFGFVLSFVPLGGNALAQGLVGSDQVWSLLDSAMSAGVGIQGAVTPLLLDKFVQRADLIIAPEGWERISAEDQAMFKDSVQALDMTWDNFCGIVHEAALRRRSKAACADRLNSKGTSGICEALRDSSSLPEVIDDISSHVSSNSLSSIVELQRDDQNEVSSGLAVGVAISSIADKYEALCNFRELKMAISDEETLMSMSNEDLSECDEAVMINFAEDSRPQFHVLASCLRNFFQKKVITGDVLVGFPKDALLNQIVKALEEDENYQVLDDDVTGTFEWRLERFLSGLRST